MLRAKNEHHEAGLRRFENAMLYYYYLYINNNFQVT